MQELDKNITLPYQEEQESVFPPTVAREQATYTGELSSDDAISTANDVEFDLSTTGINTQYDAALNTWKEHQEQTNRDAVIDIISDPEMDRDTKLTVVKKFQENGFESTNLRDAFVLDSASSTEAPVGEPVVDEDFEAQQAWIDRVRDNIGFADQTQAMKLEFDKNLSGSTEGALASIVLDTLLPTDIHSINSARIANKLGITVEQEDLPFGVQILSALSPLTSTAMFQMGRDFIFNGTLSKKMGEAFDSATPEQQADMMEIITETAADSFGTDFNKFTAIQSAIDPIENEAGVAALDFLGIVGLVPLVGAIASPVKTARHFTTLKTGLKKGGPDVVDVPLTARDEVVKSPQEPTGKADINATDSVVTREIDGTPNDVEIGIADAQQVSKEARIKATTKKVEGKIFTQSDQAVARGNNVARVSTDKFEELVSNDPTYVDPGNIIVPPQLAGKSRSEKVSILQQFPDEGLKQVASDFHIVTENKNRTTLAENIADFIEKNSKLKSSKGYKEFSKSFDNTSQVKAPEIRVSEDGKVFFEEGSLRYAVMRDKGLNQMSLSMNPESMANAVKNGLINEIPPKETILDIPTTTRLMRSTVPPSSPAGVMAATNPVKASNRYASAIVNQDGTEAQHLGTSKLEMVNDSLFTKLDDDINSYYPNTYQKLKLMDKEFEGAIKQAEVNPLVHNPQEREREVELYLKTLQGLQGGVYNQANSTLHFGRIQAEGKALYGRTADYGWDTVENANFAAEFHRKNNPDARTNVIQNEVSGQWFVQSDWAKPFNQADRWMFDAHSMDSSVLGLNTSALSRTSFGDKFVFPKTMRGDPDVAKAGLITEYNTSNIESKFFSVVRDEIFATPHKKELDDEFNAVQETGEWIAPHQFASRHPHLKPAEVESLANAYYSLKRGADYLYDITNIMDRNEILAQDLKAVVHAEKDGVVAYGKEVNPSTIADDVDVVWDLDSDQPFIMPKQRLGDGSIDLKGRTIVQTRNPVRIGTDSFEYSIIGAKTQLDAVPTRTLPKIEGWLPRKNTEAWYVRAVPTKLSMNGRSVTDSEILARQFKTVGAGATRDEAQQLANKMSKDFGDFELKVTEAQENLGDNALADYQLYQDVVRSTKKRGARLPTLNGQSRLEEPVQAFVDSTKILARQFASADHKQAFEDSFMKSFGNFIPAKPGVGKTFPNDVQDLVLPPVASTEEVKRFKVAQRLLIQFKDQRYTSTLSDTVVRDVMNAGATKLESMGFMGKEIAEGARELAKVGNLPLRFAKTVTSHLYLYLSSAQWLVQTQQLLELSAIQPSLLTKTFTQVPAISAAILSRAPHIGSSKPMANAIKKGAQKFSGVDAKEFDELVDIIYNSGLPQAVDLNQMLHGMWQKSKFTLDPTQARAASDAVSNVVSLPGKVGKTIGYGPAELAANIGTWLFARDRFIKANPKLDWKSESAVARITADAWDINHSMSGRSGSMEFQKGALGLALQFFAVQIKGFMQLLSSKTLSTVEKSKLAVARLGIYGMYGVPFGGTAAVLIDQFVDDTKDPEIINAYQGIKGGMLDATVNTMLDIAHASPKDLDAFIETGLEGAKGEGVHDLKIAERLTPVPNDKLGVPQLVVLNELFEVATGESPNGVRFPFVNAFGSLGKSVQGMMDMWRAADLDTPEKVVQSLETFASASSLGNNYNKAQAMQIARDKVGKTGSNYGIGEVTLGKIGAQFFGITTREEENVWKTKDIIKAREEGIKERSDEIVTVIEKLNLLEPDSFEYDRTIDTMNILMAYTAEGDREAVRKAVEATVKNRLQQGTMQEHYAERLWRWHADGSDKKVNEGIATLRRNAVRNPKMAELLELIQNTGYFEDR